MLLHSLPLSLLLMTLTGCINYLVLCTWQYCCVITPKPSGMKPQSQLHGLGTGAELSRAVLLWSYVGPVRWQSSASDLLGLDDPRQALSGCQCWLSAELHPACSSHSPKGQLGLYTEAALSQKSNSRSHKAACVLDSEVTSCHFYHILSVQTSHKVSLDQSLGK